MTRFSRGGTTANKLRVSLVWILCLAVVVVLGCSLGSTLWWMAQQASHDNNHKNHHQVEGVPTVASQNEERSPTTNDFSVVECTVVTPNDPSPESAANGVIRITVRPDVAPLASTYFVQLVQAGWYDDVYVFRVLKGFVAQWGAQFKHKTPPPPPPNHAKDGNNTLSNLPGTLSFAGGDPTSKQVFVNLGNNARLDKEGSHPFATVSQDSMSRVVHKLFTGYKDGQGQIPAMKEGRMLETFPHMSKITTCRVVSGGES